MTGVRILNEARDAGVSLWADGALLRYRGSREALAKLLPALRAHKDGILAALSGKINRWRITHADGQITEHSSAGLTEAEALALSRSWGEPVRAESVGVDPPSPPVDLDTVLTEACQDVEGIDAATFRALLSPEDVEDIVGGHIPAHTLNAYARSFAEGIRTGRIAVLTAAMSQTGGCCAS